MLSSVTSFNEKRGALLKEQLEKLRQVTAEGVTALAAMRLPGILSSSDGEAVPKVAVLVCFQSLAHSRTLCNVRAGLVGNGRDDSHVGRHRVCGEQV